MRPFSDLSYEEGEVEGCGCEGGEGNVEGWEVGGWAYIDRVRP